MSPEPRMVPGAKYALSVGGKEKGKRKKKASMRRRRLRVLPPPLPVFHIKYRGDSVKKDYAHQWISIYHTLKHRNIYLPPSEIMTVKHTQR